MKKLFVTISFIIIFNNLFSQTNYFNYHYNPNGTWSCSGAIYTINEGYICSGLMGDSLYYFKHNIVLSKIDSIGNLLLFKEIKLDSSDYYIGTWGGGGFAKCTNGGYILSGDIQDGFIYKQFFMRLNENLDIIWSKTINNNITFSGIFQSIETSDNGFILCGQIQTSANKTNVLLIKNDSLGNKLWEKTYNISGFNGDDVDKAWNVTETPDKGFLLGCYTYSVPSMGMYEGSGDGVVIKTDSIGNWLWTKNVGGPLMDDAAIIRVCDDGNYLIATTYAYFTAQYNDHSKSKLRIMKLTPAGNIIWDKQYEPIISSLTVKKIIELANGDIVVGGTKWFQYFSEYGYYNSYLFKLNGNGDSIWYKEYAKSTDTNLVTWNSLYNFEQTPDGGFVACGEMSVNTQIPQSIWLFKTDSMGCLQPGCQYVGVEELQKAKTGELKVFPNPANEYFIINYAIKEEIKQATAEIYDVLGKKINSISITSKIDQQLIKCADYINGQYYIVLKNNNKILKTFKFNITH